MNNVLPEIRHIRTQQTERSVTNDQVADLIGCSPMTYWRLCTGKATRANKSIMRGIDALAKEWGFEPQQ